MKRDARIGLAVILVLGLSVTLLVTRALYNRASNLDEETAEAAAPAQANPASAANAANPANADGGASFNTDTTAPEPGPSLAAAEAHNQDQALTDFQNNHLTAGAPVTGSMNTHPLAETVDLSPTGAMSHPMSGPTSNLISPAPATNGPITQLAQPGQPAHTNVLANPNTPGVALANHNSPPVVSQETAGWKYTIAAGDNPWKISAKVFGDGRYAQKIIEANPELDPKRLRVGQAIHIPEVAGKTPKLTMPKADSSGSALCGGALPSASEPNHNVGGVAPVPAAVHKKGTTGDAAAEKHAAPAAPAHAAEAGENTYVVQSGDTLASIAKSHYGNTNAKSVQKIIDANGGLDPKHLHVGVSLKIPAAAQ